MSVAQTRGHHADLKHVLPPVMSAARAFVHSYMQPCRAGTPLWALLQSMDAGLGRLNVAQGACREPSSSRGYRCPTACSRAFLMMWLPAHCCRAGRQPLEPRPTLHSGCAPRAGGRPPLRHGPGLALPCKQVTQSNHDALMKYLILLPRFLDPVQCGFAKGEGAKGVHTMGFLATVQT